MRCTSTCCAITDHRRSLRCPRDQGGPHRGHRLGQERGRPAAGRARCGGDRRRRRWPARRSRRAARGWTGSWRSSARRCSRADGSLDRAEARRIVFADADRLAALNAIVHPYVGRRSAEIMAAAPADGVVVYDVPLLVENNLQARLRRGGRRRCVAGDPGRPADRRAGHVRGGRAGPDGRPGDPGAARWPLPTCHRQRRRPRRPADPVDAPVGAAVSGAVAASAAAERDALSDPRRTVGRVRPTTDLERRVAPFRGHQRLPALRRPAGGDRRARAPGPRRGRATSCCWAPPAPASRRPRPGWSSGCSGRRW